MRPQGRVLTHFTGGFNINTHWKKGALTRDPDGLCIMSFSEDTIIRVTDGMELSVLNRETSKWDKCIVQTAADGTLYLPGVPVSMTLVKYPGDFIGD